MQKHLILFNKKGSPRTSRELTDKIINFRDSYIKTTCALIQDSAELRVDGETFLKNGSRILSSFGMTRGGPFRDKDQTEATLKRCWQETGPLIIKIKQTLIWSGKSRERLLLDIDRTSFESVTNDIWNVMKEMLPFTIGATSYGLVGASKLLFSILPEIALPIDNDMWLKVFQTVDFGDVIRWMASDIRQWEEVTGERLNELDPTGRLSTLPSVYNVMAMAARAY